MPVFATPLPAPNPGTVDPPNVDDCFPFIMPGMPLLDPNPPPNPGEDEPKPATPLLTPKTPVGESEVFATPLFMPGPGPNPGVVAVVVDPNPNPVEDDTAFPNAELDFNRPCSFVISLNPPPNLLDGDPPNVDCDPLIASPPPASPSDLSAILLFIIPPPAPNPDPAPNPVVVLPNAELDFNGPWPFAMPPLESNAPLKP